MLAALLNFLIRMLTVCSIPIESEGIYDHKI